MEQFSLEKYLENPSRKIVTERNKEVRIICTDINCAYPIIAAVKFNDDRETPLSYDVNGKCPFYEGNDLFFADEEEKLTEFEKELERFRTQVLTTSGEKYNKSGESVIKEFSKKLFDLAIKGIEKDLPKWKKATEKKDLEKHIAILEENKVLLSNYLEEGDYYIDLEDLKALPKEE